MPCIPPESAESGKRFPPKTFPGPPVGESQCRHHADRLSCPGSPRFRDLPRQDRLCRRKDRSPLAVYYITVQEANQAEMPARRKEKRLRSVLFSRWSNLLVKFRVGSCPLFRNTPPSTHPRKFEIPGTVKRKTASGADHGCGWNRVLIRTTVRISCGAHFGIRNSGIGICISSYMFIYCAKSR